MDSEEIFDEELYLRKYPDVARAVEAGIMPSGKHHYLHHGRVEGRYPELDKVIHESNFWIKYKTFAAFHEDIDNFDMFNEFMDKIKAGDNFHVSRYNDGEWVGMLQIEPYKSTFIKRFGHDKKGFEEVSEKMLAIIDSLPEYYIGIDSNTRALRGLIAGERDACKLRMDALSNVIYGDIFNAATIKFGIDALFGPLKKRYTISIGPPYMAALGASAHVIVPTSGCWLGADRIEAHLGEIIDKNLSKNPVIVYSCSFLAKILIDAFYKKYKNNISQLDVGSCIDPWCGIRSRPWHLEQAKHYQLNLVTIRRCL